MNSELKQVTAKIGGMALYPHTLRIDPNGIVWFSIQMSNQMGRFDPKTGKTNIIELPTKMARKDERTPAPYGVDISPVDGSIWYTKLWANMIGRIDPVTFAVQEWEPPVIGPRRAPCVHEILADETRTARNQNALHPSPLFVWHPKRPS